MEPTLLASQALPPELEQAVLLHRAAFSTVASSGTLGLLGCPAAARQTIMGT